jgi:glycerol-3-phosphate O-acyltransferase
LFRHFIQTQIEQGVLRPDANGKLGYHVKLSELAEGAAKRVLSAEVRLSIRQVALQRSEDTTESPA